MTRAEAIKILINYGENNIIARTRVGIAFDMAIKSLETDEAYQLEYEYEKNKALFGKIVKEEDCISRTDALHCLTGRIELIPSDMPALKAYLDYVNKRINDLPSVYPKSEAEECISRADAIRVASGYCHPSNVAKELAKLPSVTPQDPKTGHWITKPHVYGAAYCSECDFELKIDNTNYCPNCGAKMVEPQESEG